MVRISMAQKKCPRVTIGVDTHSESHTAVAKDELGRRLGVLEVPAGPAGYALLAAWAKSLGEVVNFGVEGPGSYGAGLAQHLRDKGHVVLEVARPNRQARRRNGKSDPADADAAASAVLAGEALGIPKSMDGPVESLRAMRIARQSAMKARTQAMNEMRALLVTAPSELREQLRSLSGPKLVEACQRLRPGELTDPVQGTKDALRTLARRHAHLSEEIDGLDKALGALIAEIAPQLLAHKGIGPDSAGALLVTVGDNPERLGSEASFAAICGSSPVEASSGKVVRHRLNRGGNRQANSALYHIVINRLSWDQRTKDYMARRTAEGRSKKETIRCLKRYVAREVYAAIVYGSLLEHPAAAA
jgi:transposase